MNITLKSSANNVRSANGSSVGGRSHDHALFRTFLFMIMDTDCMSVCV
jgi:hypothetical protein